MARIDDNKNYANLIKDIGDVWKPLEDLGPVHIAVIQLATDIAFFNAYTDPDLVADRVDPPVERTDVLKYLNMSKGYNILEAIEYKRRLILLNKGISENEENKKEE